MGRILIAAICGAVLAVALSGAAPRDEGYAQTQDRETRQQIADALTAIADQNRKTAALKVTESAEKDTGCNPPRDRRDSDLCAQWKAADAAAESAKWSLYGLIASVITVVALGATIWQGRQNLDLARSISVTENRAWITQNIRIESFHFTEERCVYVGKLMLKNLGKFPAVLSYGSDGQLFGGGYPIAENISGWIERAEDREQRTHLLPSEERTFLLIGSFETYGEETILPYLTVTVAYSSGGVKGLTCTTYSLLVSDGVHPDSRAPFTHLRKDYDPAYIAVSAVGELGKVY